MLDDLADRLDALVHIGLGLPQPRPRVRPACPAASRQRVKMVRHLGSALTDVTYVFDEPSVGLHPHDVHRLNELLVALRDKGNTVLVVEHKPEVIAIADHVVDMGPGAGGDGRRGRLRGRPAGLRTSGTLTGNHLTSHQPLKTAVRHADRQAGVKDATLQQPAGRLGRHPARRAHRGHRRGRLRQELADPGRACPQRYPGRVVVDQAATRGSRRSNPATYTGMLDTIRKAFAKANGVKRGPVQRQLRGRLPRVRRARRHLHRPGASSSR